MLLSEERVSCSCINLNRNEALSIIYLLYFGYQCFRIAIVFLLLIVLSIVFLLHLVFLLLIVLAFVLLLLIVLSMCSCCILIMLIVIFVSGVKSATSGPNSGSCLAWTRSWTRLSPSTCGPSWPCARGSVASDCRREKMPVSGRTLNFFRANILKNFKINIHQNVSRAFNILHYNSHSSISLSNFDKKKTL